MRLDERLQRLFDVMNGLQRQQPGGEGAGGRDWEGLGDGGREGEVGEELRWKGRGGQEEREEEGRMSGWGGGR